MKKENEVIMRLDGGGYEWLEDVRAYSKLINENGTPCQCPYKCFTYGVAFLGSDDCTVIVRRNPITGEITEIKILKNELEIPFKANLE